MSLDGSPAMPVKALVILTCLVLLAHLVVLGTSPASLGMKTPQSEFPRTFTTRSIALAPQPAPPAGPALAPADSRAPKIARPKAQRHPITRPSAPLKQDSAPVEAVQPPAEEAQPVPSAQTGGQAPVEADTGTLSPPQPAPPAQRPSREALPALAVNALPASVRLRYTVLANKFPFNLNSELLWQHDGKRFETRLEFSAFGQSRVQTSQGDITPEGLAPLRFSDKFRSEVAAHFDRQKGKVTFSANTPDAPLLAGAQDRLSILVQLGAMLASHPEAYPEATTIAVQTIGPREADTWLFTVGQEETLVLPGGEQRALKLVRNPRKEFDQRVEVWLAPSMGYLPVRIRITEAGGAYVDQQWLASQPQ